MWMWAIDHNFLLLQFRNQYDSDVTVWSPQGRLHQVEYAMEAVKLGSATVGLKNKQFAVLIALKRAVSELSAYQKKIIPIDEHIGISISGLTADARMLRYFKYGVTNYQTCVQFCLYITYTTKSYANGFSIFSTLLENRKPMLIFLSLFYLFCFIFNMWILSKSFNIIKPVVYNRPLVTSVKIIILHISYIFNVHRRVKSLRHFLPVFLIPVGSCVPSAWTTTMLMMHQCQLAVWSVSWATRCRSVRRDMTNDLWELDYLWRATM